MLLVGLVGVIATGCGTDSDCEDDSVEQRVCVECGPAGGCGKYVEQCARTCDKDADCERSMPSGPFRCFQGVCQISGCI
jgi:hypothetical protein